MTNQRLSELGASQASLDLETGCHWRVLPDSSIRLLVPTREASTRLELELNIPARLAFVRNIALQGIGESEVFAQKSFVVGRDKSGDLFVVVVSMLTTHLAWRGGWIAVACPVGEEERLQKYFRTTRVEVVAELRRERTQRGSNS
jgi:hypothetical protein